MSIDGESRILIHHGILGQKKGIRNGPPYPLNPAKDYSKDEKKEALAKGGKAATAIKEAQNDWTKKSGKDVFKSNIKDVASAIKSGKEKERLINRSKKTIEEVKQETKEEIRQRIINHPTPEEVVKNKDLFSYNELNAFKSRFQLEKDIASFIPKDTKNGETFGNKLAKTSMNVANKVVNDLGPKAATYAIYKTLKNSSSDFAKEFADKIYSGKNDSGKKVKDMDLDELTDKVVEKLNEMK